MDRAIEELMAEMGPDVRILHPDEEEKSPGKPAEPEGPEAGDN
jgi:hypothetical protein